MPSFSNPRQGRLKGQLSFLTILSKSSRPRSSRRQAPRIGMTLLNKPRLLHHRLLRQRRMNMRKILTITVNHLDDWSKELVFIFLLLAWLEAPIVRTYTYTLTTIVAALLHLRHRFAFTLTTVLSHFCVRFISAAFRSVGSILMSFACDSTISRFSSLCALFIVRPL